MGPESIPGAYQRPDGLWVIPRKAFFQTMFHFKAGQHVAFGGPTQHGKTTICFDALEVIATPETPAFVAVSKPRDPVTERRGKALGFRRVSEWPPTVKPADLFRDKPRGYLVWPKFGDIDRDPEITGEVLGRLISDRYVAGIRREKGILVLDDTLVKAKVQKLDGKMVTILAMAGAMELSAFTFVQKPTGAGETALMSYGNSEHLFLTKDPDTRNSDRYNEIGGVDGKFVSQALRSLKPFQFLYICRNGTMCVIDKG